MMQPTQKHLTADWPAITPIVARALAKRAGLRDDLPCDAWMDVAKFATETVLAAQDEKRKSALTRMVQIDEEMGALSEETIAQDAVAPPVREEEVERVVKALDSAHCDIWIKLKPKALRSMALAVAQALSPPPLAPRTDLRFAIEEARRVLSETPELNMSNYNEDDVAAQNAGLIEVYKILDAAVAGEAA